MPRLRFPLVACLAGLMWAQASAASDWKLPPLDGALSGEFTPLKVPGAPALHWDLAVHTNRPRERAVEFSVTGPGATLRGDALLDPKGEGTWRLAAAEIDVNRWLGALTPYLGAGMAGLTIAGTATLSGEGTWRAGVLGGRATVSLREGRIDDPAHKLLLEGVAFTVTVEDLAARRTAPAQVLTWRSGRYDVIEFGAGRVEFALTGDDVRVEQASLAIFGGELIVGSLVFSTVRPDVSVRAQVKGVEVAKLLFLLPPVLADARGRLDGQLALKRDAAGIQIGAGRLALREGETADLRLAPTPGLLSSSLPPAVLKYYPGLGKMETGGIPLRATLLEVTFTPEGDAAGRTASVHLAGGPEDPSLRAPIDLAINVRGPLESLVKFGTESRLRFGSSR